MNGMTPPAPPATLLCVDDEANILNSLRRLFRPHGYRLLTAESGAEGLKIMEGEAVDLVISDMRMPQMSGAEFLAQVRARWPDTLRILLTGHADMQSTIDAINQGGIYRYIAKPWEDSDVTLLVRQALEHQALAREKARLEAEVLRQNEALRELNASLEHKVEARTEALRKTMESLSAANDKLKGNFLTTIKVFSQLMAMRFGNDAGHAREVADMARKLATQLHLPAAETQDVTFAGLLKDVGRIGLPDEVLAKAEQTLNTEELALMRKTPLKGESALMAIEELRGAARLLRARHERFDGMGYPDGLVGVAIPMGARILAVAGDFDALQRGMLVNKRLPRQEALVFIKEGRGRRYDPQVVDAFLAQQGAPAGEPPQRELAVRTAQLQPGMVLNRDLIASDGVLLLASDYILDDMLIRHIREFEERTGTPLTVHIRANRR